MTITLTISGTGEQLAPIVANLRRDGHTVELTDLPEILLECDMEREWHVAGDDVGDVVELRAHGGVAVRPQHDPCVPATDLPALPPDVVDMWGGPEETPAAPEPSAGIVVDTFDLAWAQDDVAAGIAELEQLERDDVDEDAEVVGDAGVGDDPDGESNVGQPSPTTTADEDLVEPSPPLHAEDTPTEARPVADETSTTVRPMFIDDTALPMADRIVMLLEANPDRVWTAPQVGEHITDARSTAVISAAMSTLIKAGRINRVGHGRYTAPAAPDQDELDDVDDAAVDLDERSLPGDAERVLKLMRSSGDSWTVDGLLLEFPTHSEISMRSGVLGVLQARGLITTRHEGAATTYRAVSA